MTDDLGTRIAAVVDAYFDTMRREQGYIVDGVTGDDVADAVIRELGLQRASRPNDYGYVKYPPGYQYTTDWIADE